MCHVYNVLATKLKNERANEVAKNSHPLIALQAAPGCGKSFFLDLVAECRVADIDTLCTKQTVEEVLNGSSSKRKREEITDPPAEPRGFQVPDEEIFAELRTRLKKAIRISISFNETSSQDAIEKEKETWKLGWLTDSCGAISSTRRSSPSLLSKGPTAVEIVSRRPELCCAKPWG